MREDGLGTSNFGTDAQAVIDYVASILGGSTADTGWVASNSFASCPGTQARRVDWGVLSLLFADQSQYRDGGQHFIGWEYGHRGSIGDPPAGLHTANGIHLASTVAELKAAFPGVEVNEGDPNSDFPDNFYVNDALFGLLSGPTDTDFVTMIYGGPGCGE